MKYRKRKQFFKILPGGFVKNKNRKAKRKKEMHNQVVRDYQISMLMEKNDTKLALESKKIGVE